MSWSIQSVREAELSAADIFSCTRTRRRGAREATTRASPWQIETEVRPPGLTVVERFEMQPASGGIAIRHEIEVSGKAAGFTGLTLKPIYQRWLEKETGRLVVFARRLTDVKSIDP